MVFLLFFPRNFFIYLYFAGASTGLRLFIPLYADEHLAKGRIVICIEDIIQKRGLKQLDAAHILGVKQPKISALMNGQFRGFSMDKLIHFLNLLNQDVKIIIKSRQLGKGVDGHGRLSVAFG